MKSLLDPIENRNVLKRIDSLSPERRSQWGKMNVAQMLAHCQVPLKVAAGELVLKRGLIALLFGRMAKKQMLKEEPFKQNLPTDSRFTVSDSRQFEEEKKKLMSLVERFINIGEGISKIPHPFFGELSAEEWGAFQWKHLDHHLRQFGA